MSTRSCSAARRPGFRPSHLERNERDELNDMSEMEHTTSTAHTGPVLLDAQTVAVVGASPDDNKIGGKPMRFLREFEFRGRIFPVNPRYQEIGGHRCYPDIASIGMPIDAAILAVPYQHAQPIIEQCVRHGVRQIIMFSSGYAETGAEGAARQQKLLRTVEGSGTRLLGPNTLGLANLASGFIAHVRQAWELPPGVLGSGRTGVVSQSGAFASMLASVCNRTIVVPPMHELTAIGLAGLSGLAVDSHMRDSCRFSPDERSKRAAEEG